MTNYPPIDLIDQIDPLNDREGFLTLREPHFGASATACLFGEHPFMSAADYWLEKVTGVPQQDETPQMRRGSHLEPAVASWFAQEIGFAVRKAKYMYVRGHLAATPDYFTAEEENADIVEIKTTTKRIDEPERYWVWQVQAQMLCTDATKAYIVWVDASMDIQWTEVDADPDMQAKVWTFSKLFMESVATETMPDWVETEARHIIAMFPDASDDALEAGDKGMDLVHIYWSHKAAAKYHDEAADKMRDELFTLAGNHDALTDEGTVICTLRPRKLPARFDTRSFKELHPNLYLEFLSEPMTTRVLNIPAKLKKVIEGTN